jgi:hypothetical protein
VKTYAPNCLFERSVIEVAALCQVSESQVRRWRYGSTPLPHLVEQALSQDLSFFDPAWKGWRIRNGKLSAPEGYDYSPGDVLQFEFVQSQLRAWRKEAKELREELARGSDAGPQMIDQPAADDAAAILAELCRG